MATTEIIDSGGAVRLPDGFRFEGDVVSIRKEGDAVILEPIKPEAWPVGFWAAIRIDDAAFARPPQGRVPALPPLD